MIGSWFSGTIIILASATLIGGAARAMWTRRGALGRSSLLGVMASSGLAILWQLSILLGRDTHEVHLLEAITFGSLALNLAVVVSANVVRLNRELAATLERERSANEAALIARSESARAERLAAMGTLVAGVAHEINNPLTYILGNLELVKASVASHHRTQPSEEDVARLEKQVDSALRGVGRITRIVKALNRFSRREEVNAEVVAPGAILDEALTLADSRLSGIGVEVNFSTDRKVLANAGQLAQVLLNVLINAAEAVADRPEKAISIDVFDTDDGRIAIEVLDSGPGISPEDEACLFVPFHTTKPQGTGLGLAISRRVMEDGGGTLAYRRGPKGGAIFCLTLPAAQRKAGLRSPDGSSEEQGSKVPSLRLRTPAVP